MESNRCSPDLGATNQSVRKQVVRSDVWSGGKPDLEYVLSYHAAAQNTVTVAGSIRQKNVSLKASDGFTCQVTLRENTGTKTKLKKNKRLKFTIVRVIFKMYSTDDQIFM